MNDEKIITISAKLSFYRESDNLNAGDCIFVSDGYSHDDVVITLDDWQSFKDAVDKSFSDSK